MALLVNRVHCPWLSMQCFLSSPWSHLYEWLNAWETNCKLSLHSSVLQAFLWQSHPLTVKLSCVDRDRNPLDIWGVGTSDVTMGSLFSGGSETFQDKVNFFQRELRQVHMKRPHSKVTLKVSRHSLLESVSDMWHLRRPCAQAALSMPRTLPCYFFLPSCISNDIQIGKS